MKNFIWSLLLLPLFSYATVCPSWTQAQRDILLQAKLHGEEYDLGYTLAAIVAQESFVGPYIIRSNGADGKFGSWGITHVSLEFAMESLGYKNLYAAKQDIIPKLLTDDELAFRLSIRKLQQSQKLPWRKMTANYNGAGSAAELYAEKVAVHLKTIQRCL